MKKKKILFTMGSLGIGGAEKSLVTLLSNIDYSQYEVDLMLFNPKGEFINLVPSEVNIIHPHNDYMMFDLNPKKSLIIFLKNLKLNMFLYNFIYLLNLFLFRVLFKKEYIGWNIKKNMLKKIDKEYDLSVGFLEKQCNYFTVDKTIANKKVGWIHIDYSNIEYNYNIENLYFNKLDNIVTVSKHCKDVLQDLFPKNKDKVLVIENMVSTNIIKKLSNDRTIDTINCKNNEVVIATVCRLEKQKGIDIAISACEGLIKKGYSIRWLVVGEGSQRKHLEDLIKEKELQNNFILLGSRTNPYPYIKNCDIYVQPSRWEGFGITVLEAKILNKPIVTSNIPEFKEQIKHEVNGLIYENIEEFIVNIERLINDKDLRDKFTKNLNILNLDNSDEIKKLIDLI